MSDRLTIEQYRAMVPLRRQHPETAVQIALIEALSLRGVPGLIYWHTPFETRSAAETLRLTRMGALKGLPDLLLLREGRLRGMELKRDQGGKLSRDQAAVHAAMERAGATCAVAHGLDEALDQLRSWGLLR